MTFLDPGGNSRDPVGSTWPTLRSPRGPSPPPPAPLGKSDAAARGPVNKDGLSGGKPKPGKLRLKAGEVNCPAIFG